MTDTNTDVRGLTLRDNDGDKIGKIDELYTHGESDAPQWALVNTGLFGMKSTFVPLDGATRDGNDVRVPFTKDQVKDAPRIESDEELSPEEEQRLFTHYGFGGTSAPAAGEQPTTETTAPTGTDDAMTRSEEEVQVGTRAEETGRARLRKYVVTEQVQTTVPVQREELRVEREPITEENRDEALSGAEITEAEHEVVLHEEQPVVEKQVVPKERVRLDTETVTDERAVDTEVRKEQIETEQR